MPKLDPNYIVGLVDGEGSFTVYVRDPSRKKNVKRRVRVEPRFYVNLVEDDKEILEELKDFFGCGSIYFQGDKRENHRDCYRYEVFNRGELREVIIPFFKKHSPKITSKQKDFDLFCQIMDLIDQRVHLKKEGLERIYRIKQRMH